MTSAGSSSILSFQFPLRRGDLVEDHTRMPKQNQTFLRQPHTAGAPFEQRRAGLPLEGGDLTGHRGLHDRVV
jgi:hypothetical protein